MYHVNIKSILAHNFEEKKEKTDHNPLPLCLTNQMLIANSRAQPSGEGVVTERSFSQAVTFKAKWSSLSLDFLFCKTGIMVYTVGLQNASEVLQGKYITYNKHT